jgi:aspartyl-tRNA(Asn)/glutamyl-tRNA(Gln) amidotransferase subunit B
MHSPKEAVAFAMAVKAIMQYIDASDCNMEEGSLRVDCNVSVRRKLEKTLRPKSEIKNLNSFHNIELALEAEIVRQIRAYARAPHEDFLKINPPATYRFDPQRKEILLMRKKESADDYRYFPEPDLPPIILSESFIEQVRASLPELPHERFKRYLSTYGLAPDAAALLVSDKPLSDYFEEALQTTHSPKAVCNWITIEFIGRYKDTGKTLLDSGIRAEHIAQLVHLIEKGTITGKIGKSVADAMVASPGKDPQQIVTENPDFQPIHDTSSIEPLVEQVLAAHPQSIADYKAGKGRAFDFLVGQVMKLCKGKASPSVVNALLASKLKSLV